MKYCVCSRIVLVLATILLMSFSVARAATILVTSTADSGPGTLRGALTNAHNGDLIDARGVSGTILLTNLEIWVTNSVTILGPGPANLKIDGNQNMGIYISENLSVTISGLTITNCNSAGGSGIYNYASSLTVSNCSFSGNGSAYYGSCIVSDGYGANAALTVLSSTFSNNWSPNTPTIYADGTYSGNSSLFVSNCIFSGNWSTNMAGLMNDGGSSGHATATIVNSLFTGNFGAYGAGPYNRGSYSGNATMTVVGCTLTNNSANFGAALYNDGFGTGSPNLFVTNCLITGNSAQYGGGIYNNGGLAKKATLVVVNTTFSGNNASIYGGGINSDCSSGTGVVTVVSCTFSGNSANFSGSGIYNTAAVTGTALFNVGNSMFKAGASGANIGSDGGGVMTSLGYNLSSDNGGGFLVGTGDQINTDPRLGPLQNNGGPTLTHAISFTSPALDRGRNLTGSATDQRGLPRLVDLCPDNANDGTDIGAVEFQTSELTASTFTVLNTNDSGLGSLREAILAANTCPDTNTITFAPSAYGKIKLTSGQLVISSPLFINGPGATNVVIDGNGTNRIFSVLNGLSVAIANLTLTNGFGPGGDGGGALLNNQSSVTVSNCFITGNQGAAINNNGIPTSAILFLNNCTLSGNSGSLGGAVVNNGGGVIGSAAIGLANCTISSNTGGFAGAVYNRGAFQGSGTVQPYNCTFSQNHATNSDAGIFNTVDTGTAYLLIGSSILNATKIVNASGTVFSQGYNLSSDNGGGFLTATADQINTDPRIGPLQNNGGPTPTHALLTGSLALDKGKNLSGTSSDQRGLPRLVDNCPAKAAGGDGTDIGAVEMAAFTIPTTITVVNNSDSGPGSLREALLAASVCPDTNVITFAPSAYGAITLTSGELVIDSPLSIIGPGATNVAINCNATSRGIYVSSGLNVTIAGLAIGNGTNLFGGGIYNDHSTLSVSNCVVTGCKAYYGGGIYNSALFGSGTLFVSGCMFSGNFSSDEGGALYNEEGGTAFMSVLNSTFSTNTATTGGGGIWNAGDFGQAALVVSACTFSGNRANSLGVYGGAINNAGAGTVQIGNTLLNAGATGKNLVSDSSAITSFGYNLSSDDGSGQLNQASDQINANPLLGPLQFNGGPTPTHAPLTGSPAIDKGKRNAVASLPANTDQRGIIRPLDQASVANAVGGDGSDIGAVEVSAAPSTPIFVSNPQKVVNGAFQFAFTNNTGTSFTVLMSTNVGLPLGSWTVLGSATEVSPGNYQFTHPQATNYPRAFYTIRSP